MSKSPLQDFVKLNDIISLYRPPQSNGHLQPATTSSNGPDLIVLCSWMDAAPKHIAKYISGYHLAFPSAQILLIQSKFSGVFFGTDLNPAIDFLGPYAKDTASANPSKKRVLLSLFSNGGANVVTLLATSLLDKFGAVPFDALIFDCCPSRGSMRDATKAITFSLPNNPLVRAVGWYLVYAMVVTYVVVVETLRIEDMAARFLRVLNDPGIISTRTPRLYMYSRGDELVMFRDVQKHAEGARKAGYSTREEEFLTAAHCSLVTEDSGRYWGAVKALVMEGTTV